MAAWFVRKTAPALASAPDERHVHLAIDGKALKSTGEQAYGGEHPQQHVLHLYEVETGVVLQRKRGKGIARGKKGMAVSNVGRL